MRFLPLVLSVLFAGFQPAAASLTAIFSSDGQTVTHQVPRPALLVKVGEPPAAGLAPGKFSANYKGTLKIPVRYRVYFTIESNGAFTMKVDGEEVTFTEGKSERLRLNPGEVPIEIDFQSTDSGAGSFRLHWEERRAFPKEPVPNDAFAPLEAPIDPAHLFADQHCAQCHKGDLGKYAMPELQHVGPELSSIGNRANEAWLTRWIAQPDKLKPTATMPAMVDHTKPEGAQAAADLGAYLATLGAEGGEESNQEPAKFEKELVLEGGVHFHELGCAACHTKPDAAEPDFENKRIPLNNVAAKYKGTSLVEFLKNPAKHHKSVKMPDFRFSAEEANTLAAYLTQTSTGNHTTDPSEFPPGDAVRGKEIASSLNCASCHEGLPAAKTEATSLAELTKLASWHEKGCLGPDEKRGRSPRLILSDEEKKSITPAILPALKFDTPAAFAHRNVEALNCVSCHDNNGQPPLLLTTHAETKNLLDHVEEADERLIQSRPPLTHMGAMLHTPYLVGMLKGDTEPRPRPWLDMRMPGIHQHAELMAKGLARHHGLDESAPSEEKFTADQIETGKNIVSITGYACVTCHAINEEPAIAAFEVKGINLGEAHRRLRADYYHQWMFNPTRLVPDTKMPRYTNPDDGTALRTDILEGDAKAQFEAVRAYLQSVDQSAK